MTEPPYSDTPRGPLFLRGLGRKGRGRFGGGTRLRSAGSGEGPADCAGECAPTGPPAQPLAGRFALDRLLPCSALAESVSVRFRRVGLASGCLSNPGTVGIELAHAVRPRAWVQLAACRHTDSGLGGVECPVSFDLGEAT